MMDRYPLIVVDAANVVGSVPDGWWRDRAGATQRLCDRLAAAISSQVAGERSPGGQVAEGQSAGQRGARRRGAGRQSAGQRSEEWAHGTEECAAEIGGHRLCAAEVVLVVEGRAREIEGASGVVVIRAAGSGDDAIVECLRDRPGSVDCVVVTADRDLGRRVRQLGARVVRPGVLLDQLS